jgi:hypothetical protein
VIPFSPERSLTLCPLSKTSFRDIFYFADDTIAMRDLPGTEQLTFERFELSLLDTWIHVKLPWLLCKQNRDRVVCKIKDVPKRSFGKGTKSQTSLGWKGDPDWNKCISSSGTVGGESEFPGLFDTSGSVRTSNILLQWEFFHSRVWSPIMGTQSFHFSLLWSPFHPREVWHFGRHLIFQEI